MRKTVIGTAPITKRSLIGLSTEQLKRQTKSIMIGR